jgi:hypothetical protein
MRKTRIGDQFSVFQKLYGLCSGDRKRYDLVVFTMQNKHRNIDAFKVFGKICFRKSLNTFIARPINRA